MPMYGYSRATKRRRSSYGMGLGAALTAARSLRKINAPAMAHTFARPGFRLLISQQNGPLGAYQVSPAPTTPPGTTVPVTAGISFGTVGAGDIINTSSVGFSQTFAFNQLTAFSELANLYDNYRIKAVKLKIELSFNNAPNELISGPGGGFSAFSLPMLHYAIDPDDASVPANANVVLEYSKSRSVRLGEKPVYITLVPRAQGGVATAAAVSPGVVGPMAVGTMLPTNTWLDCQNAQGIPHYGMKYFLENMPSGYTPTGGTQVSWAMYITPIYILECKNQH